MKTETKHNNWPDPTKPKPTDGAITGEPEQAGLNAKLQTFMEERIAVSLTENDWSKVRQALLEKVFKEREISINLNLPSSTSAKYNELYHWIGYEIEKHYQKAGAK